MKNLAALALTCMSLTHPEHVNTSTYIYYGFPNSNYR